MSDSTVVPLRQPDTIEDALTAILRSGARRLLAQAIEAEAEAFLAAMQGARLPDGRERVVRHGHGPERMVHTGIGPVAVRRAKLRDRGAGEGGERIRFSSAILPRWARRTRSLDALLPSRSSPTAGAKANACWCPSRRPVIPGPGSPDPCACGTGSFTRKVQPRMSPS